MSNKRTRIHERELRRMLSFIGIFGALSLATYAIPGMELVQPWVPTEPVPLVHLALDRAIVTENQFGELVRQVPGDAHDPIDDTGMGGDHMAPEEPVDGTTEEVFDDPPVAPAPASPETGTPAPPADAPWLGPLAPAAEDDADTPLALALPDPSPPGPPRCLPGECAPPPTPRASAVASAPSRPPSATARVVVEVPALPIPERSAAASDVARPGNGALRDRDPAKATALEVPPGALDHWFASLSQAAAGTPGHIARTLHWGDSTIAGDGITRTVRQRLQGRFGDGGPGFLAVQVDARWASRPGILRNTKGAWKTRTITFGGANNGYYGLGGTVSTAYGAATSTLGGNKVGEQLQALHRFDIAFQTRPDGGTLMVEVEGGEGATFQTRSENTADAFHTFTAPAGAQKLNVVTTGDGPVTVYGVALETRGPGMTWETLGVAGAGQGSMFRQGDAHLARQVAWRRPDLIVYQMGGNELGYPSLKSGGGKVWKDRYVKVVRKLRAGAPEASCMLVTPLDQGERVRGAVHSKPTLATMVRLQRETAREMGCAFWDAQAAMGGSGSFGVWLSKKLAWSDLYHLTNKGLAIIGHTLADAIEAAYDDWRGGGAVSAASSHRAADG